jgi:hypothetical protein
MVRFRSRSDDGFGFELSCFTTNVSGSLTTAVHTFATLVWTEQSYRLHRRYCGRTNPLLSTQTESAESVLASLFTDASLFRRAAWIECKAKLCNPGIAGSRGLRNVFFCNLAERSTGCQCSRVIFLQTISGWYKTVSLG